MDDSELEQKLQELPGKLLEALWTNIGNNVRRMRQERRLTQELLSEMTGGEPHGISVRTIIRLEKGTAVSLETLQCIAGALDVDLIGSRTSMRPQAIARMKRDILEQVARANNISLPVIIFDRFPDARSLMAAMNNTDGISKPMFESLINDKEEDTAVEFTDLLNKHAPGFPDLDLAGRVALRRTLDASLSSLKRFGFCLYGAPLSIPVSEDGRFGLKRFLVLRINRRDVPFVADFVPETFKVGG